MREAEIAPDQPVGRRRGTEAHETESVKAVGPAVTFGDLLGRRGAAVVPYLQRAVGNKAVAAIIQRQAPAAAPTVDHVSQLDELMGHWFVDQKIVDLLGQMTAGEKTTVLSGYRDRLTKKLSFSKLHEAVNILGANLPTKLDWLEKTAILGATGIKWDEIKDDVTSAPQTERDMLKNERWKSFFISVCTNATIIPAVQALGFDLATQLTWVKGEASALFSLNLDKLRPLLTGRRADELATVSGEAWLSFWTDVCTNATMEQLVQILFPNDLVKQLHFMNAEGTDAGLIKARVTAAPPDQRLAVYGSPEAVALIHSFLPPDRAAIIQLLGGTPTQQLQALGRDALIPVLTWATPSQEWVDALKSNRDDPLDVFVVAGSNLAWAPFIKPRLAELFRGKTSTVFGDMVNVVWAAYGDGSSFNSADTLVVFRALFGRDVEPAGDVTFYSGFTSRKRYRAVSPDDAAARELMKMVKVIPRNQVAEAPIAFCDTGWIETLGLRGWSGPAMTDFDASFFWRDRIIIKVTSTGAMDSGQIDTVGGEAAAYGGPGTTGPGGVPYTGGTALTFFQNHVRHEIGHAIGQKRFGSMGESGDDFAEAYGGWKGSSKGNFLANMWTGVAMPATGWPSIDFGGGAVTVTDTQVRDWLVGLVGDGTEVGGPIKNGTNTMRQKIMTIAGSLWSGQQLTNYVSNIRGNNPATIQDSAYEFPGFTPPNPVHIYSTREANRFMTYSKAAHDALHASTGWYSLSSHFETFAEMYTRKYSGGGTPAAVNGKDPAAFFTELEAQDDPMFGQPTDTSPPTVAE
jgi:hypothetical protein